MAKKIKIKKTYKIIGLLLVLVIIMFTLLTTNIKFIGKHSIHSDASKYSTRHCLAFYPDSKDGKKIAKQICKDVKNDSIYDYSLVPYGDYQLVNYGNGISYFVDKNFDTVVINEVNDAEGKMIISDYLRYTIKKNKKDMYYDSKFLLETYVDNLDFSLVTYELVGETLKCHFPQYEIDVDVPLKYMQKPLGMNFNYPNERYIKPTYIDSDPNHPVICLTFDDGPVFWLDPNTTSTENIVDTLYKYDACATFYVVGNMLEENDVWADYEKYFLFKNSIAHGNEYGSHTQDHAYYLTDLNTAEGIEESIMGPVEYFKEMMDYDMKTFRPTGGLYDENILNASPLPAILWDIDSNDWDLNDINEIVNSVTKYHDKKQIYDGDVVLFHDIYDETAQAIEKLVPKLIDNGYQLVTVSDMLNYLNIDVDDLSYYFSAIYFE